VKTNGSTRSDKWFQAGGSALAASGVAHLLFPRAFEPVNRMAFRSRIRAHVLINGGIETGLGLALLNKRTRRAAFATTLAYLTYFNASVLWRQRVVLSRTAGRVSDSFFIGRR
jgi:uncharacterized membrane protein